MTKQTHRRTELQQRIASALQNAPPQPDGTYAAADVGSLLHELSVYHEELEFQNDELRAAQAQLQALNERYADLFNRAPIGYLVIDSEHYVLLANEPMAEMLRVEVKALMGRPLTRFVDPESQDALYLHLRGIGDQTQARSTELTLSGNGRRVPVRVESVPDLHSGNLYTRMAIIDISQEFTARYALRESEERYRLMFEMADDIVLVCSLDDRHATDRIVEANNAACRSLGYTRAELVGSPAALLTDGTLFVPDTVRTQLADAGRALFETTLSARNGATIPAEIHASRYTWHGHTMVLMIARDISERRRLETERREMEQRRQQLQKWESLGVLSAGVAHDFNNLLAIVANELEIMRSEMQGDEKGLRRITRSLETIQRGTELTSKMAAYTGNTSLAMQPVNLNAVVEQALSLFYTIAPARIRLHVETAPDLPPLWADPIQLQQAVISLLTNAMESFGSGDGEIYVSSYYRVFSSAALRRSAVEGELPAGRYVCLSIRDTGSGMDEHTLARVFEPFFSTRFTGRGLGMSAVLGILRGHHGAILLDSTPGQGTSVCVILPQATTEQLATRPVNDGIQQATSSTATPEETTLPTHTLLVVEDEDYLRETCQEIFAEFGYTVHTAANGEEALRKVAEHGAGIHCVLLDLTMPGMSGLETFQAIRRMQPDLPIIVTSGHDADDVAHQFPPGTIAQYFQKPYSMSELRGVVQSVIMRNDAP